MSEGNRKPPSPLVRNILMWAGILVALVLMVQLFQGPAQERVASEEIAYSEFLRKVDEGQVKEAAISGRQITGKLSNDQLFRTYNPGDMQL
ncbi:MAG: ATP-dependent metallopeptidase FtsH/Yme1/Tma family protein, partial [Sandarakinorhabdus sp.]|nr:ATP-dependent metallopeptidase FtsH/Yme1/Tma family protein [Sandarakinorhabdus sp.]